MIKIHPSAIVHQNAKISEGVEIGAFCIIGENVTIKENTLLHPGVIINGFTTIGKNNEIFSYAVIGNPGQDKHFKNEKSFVEIGDNNIIRESVTINTATGLGTKTVIGNDCFLMASSHLGHNSKVGDGVVLVNGAGIGGFVEIEEKAFISAYCTVHQFCKIGRLVMIGMSSPIEKDVPPYVLGAGNPFTIFGLNRIGLQRNNVPEKSINALKKVYKLFFRSGLNTTQAINAVKNEISIDPYVSHFIDFVQKSERGIYK